MTARLRRSAAENVLVRLYRRCVADVYRSPLPHRASQQRARARVEADARLENLAARTVPDDPPSRPGDIRRALARLPSHQRAALVMRELESRPYAEIAQMLGLPAAAVERLVFDGRRVLREQLERTPNCHQAERAISRDLDGRLLRSERRALRRHLRDCGDCTRFARSQHARRAVWRALATMPVPASLQSFCGAAGADGAGLDAS